LNLETELIGVWISDGSIGWIYKYNADKKWH